MSVDPLRMVTDQWEWASLSRLVPSAYHDQSWSLASVTRIRSQTSLPVSFGYARVWAGESMVCCPLIRLGDRWFNTPRAVPLVIVGPPLNATIALKRAIARKDPVTIKLHLHGRLEVCDDSELVDEIARTRMRLDVRSASWRLYRAMSAREIDAMVRSLDWDDPGLAVEWGRAVKACWRAGGWETAVRVHSGDDGATVGYSLWVTRPAGSECIAAALVGQHVPAWSVAR